jgi:cyclopropane-fatty-acyl-phospholipid synthase
MSETHLHVTPPRFTGGADRPRRPSLGERLARRLVLRDLRTLSRGILTVREEGPDGSSFHRLGEEAPDGLRAEVRVRSPAFWSRVARGGSIGAAEAWVEELWTSPDLTAVIRLVARNPAINNGLEQGLAAWLQRTYRRWHEGRANSREGSRTNIAAHYDLGNDFFERFLDETMTYSCGVFPRPEASLREAQEAKLDLICRKLGLRPEHRVVEIGAGWGGFAIHAARTVGCRVWTTTISGAQREEAERRIRAAGVEDRVTLLPLDYRDLPRELGEGRFDRLVSIEMIEAVGEGFLDTYLDTCARLLRPDGLALLQAIVMSEEQYPVYRTGTDFIQRYVFPGSFLPSVQDLRRRLVATPLRLAHLDDLTAHYPPTLRAWSRAVRHRRKALLDRGYSDDFLRLWDFYLAYCEGGFLERTIGDVHLLLAGPGARVVAPVPGAPAFPDGTPPFVREGGGTPPLAPETDRDAAARGVA